jgi:acyl-coenzyme A synthetase/AMP-(fatty) acid ligase
VKLKLDENLGPRGLNLLRSSGHGVRLNQAAIAAFAAARLSSFKKPRRVEFVDALPRNAAKKVMTSQLRERFGTENK